MFNVFEKVEEYQRDRMQSEKFNDKEGVIKNTLSVEQEDAEALLNEIDLGFESHFDANLRGNQEQQNFAQMAMQNMKKRKVSSEESSGGMFGSANTLGGGNLSPVFGGGLGSAQSQGNFLGKQNRGFNSYTKVSSLTIDYEDQVPPNCSIMEVIPVYEPGMPGQPQDTIFLGTYDGSLIAYRMKVNDEGVKMTESNDQIIQSYASLRQIKKWSFSGYVVSLIHFGIQNATSLYEEMKQVSRLKL